MARLTLLNCMGPLIMFMIGIQKLGVYCVRFQPSEKYMILQSDDSIVSSKIDRINMALNLLQCESYEPRYIMNKIREAIHANSKPELPDSYEPILGLSTDDDICKPDTIRISKLLLVHLERLNRKSIDSKYKRFIEHYGKEKFRLCAGRANKEIKESIQGENKHLLESFEQFYRAALSATGCFESYFEGLMDLNLAKYSKLEIGKMADVAKTREKRRKWSFHRQKRDPYSRIENFLIENCRRMLENYMYKFDIINLASAFGNDLDYDNDIRLMNEYHRICLNYKLKDNWNEIMNNIKTQAKIFSKEKDNRALINK